MKFKIRTGKDDQPLLTRAELLKAVENHFNMEYSVNEVDLIARFLKLKKEERAENAGAYGLRKVTRP